MPIVPLGKIKFDEEPVDIIVPKDKEAAVDSFIRNHKENNPNISSGEILKSTADNFGINSGNPASLGSVTSIDSIKFDDVPPPKPKIEEPTKYPNLKANVSALGKTIAGLPKNISELQDAVISGATMGLSDRAAQAGRWASNKLFGETPVPIEAKGHEPINKYVKGAAEFAGSFAPIGVAGKLIAKPVQMGVQALSKSKYIPALSKMLGWGVAGSVYDTTENLIKEGEMPSAKEIASSGALWAGMEGVMNSIGWTGKVALGVKKFADTAGIAKKDALKIVLDEAKRTNSPIVEIAQNWTKYQKALKGLEGKPEAEVLKLKISSAAEEFVNKVGFLTNKVGTPKEDLKRSLTFKDEQTALNKVYEDTIKPTIEAQAEKAGKIGQPLIRPDNLKIKSKIPEVARREPIFPEPTGETRPAWQVEQEAAGIARQQGIDKQIVLNRLKGTSSDIGQPLIKPRDYTGQGAEIPAPLKTGNENAMSGDIRSEVQIRQDILNTKREAEIKRAIENQKIEAEKRKLKPIEETNVPRRELTPIEVAERDMVRTNKESIEATKRREILQNVLERNKPKESGREIPINQKATPITRPTASPLKTPEQDIKSTLNQMANEIKNTSGAERGTLGGDIEHKIGSSNPPWMSELNQLAKKEGKTVKGISRKDFFDTLNKVEQQGASSLSNRQSEIYNFMKRKAQDFKNQSYEEKLIDEFEWMTKEGYEPLGGEKIIAADLKKGDRVIVNGEKYTSEGINKDGNVVLSGNTPIKVDAFDSVILDGIKKEDRSAFDFFSDIRKVLRDERGSVGPGTKPLNSNQKAALERIKADAKKAGKDISKYMKDMGSTPEVIAKVLANKEIDDVFSKRLVKPKANVEISKNKLAKATMPQTADEIVTKFAKPKSTLLHDVRKGLDSGIGTVSTRLGNIATEVKDRVREHAFESIANIKTDLDKVRPFYKSLSKLSDKDQFRITQLLRNGQYDKEVHQEALNFLKEKGILDKYLQWETVRDNLLKRGRESGIKINEMNNYFPSHVKDYTGLRKSLGADAIGKIDEAIAKEAAKRNLTANELGDESKAAIIDSMLRGWSKNKIFLFDPFEVKAGIGKSRKLTTLTGQLNQHYFPAHESMIKYITNMNSAIANNNFFNKGRTIAKAIKKEGLDIDMPMSKTEFTDSIGDIIREIKRTKTLSMPQEAELKEVLTSYFMPKSQGKYVTGIKNFTYGALLGNPVTALTQLRDVGVTLSRHGAYNTIKGLAKMHSKDAYRMADIGIDNFMADFERRTVHSLPMKIAMSPLAAMDVFGKTLNMNANLVKVQSALRKELNKGASSEITKEIERLFSGSASKVKADLLKGNKTFETNFFMFNDLSKYHPISKAEVPTGYLNSNKGRLIYMLHTYQLKQLDIFRNDVLNEFKKGNIIKGSKNMTSLTFWLLSTGLGVDAARDYLTTGKTKEIDNYMLNNAGQLFLLNRYMFDKGFKQGFANMLWDGVKPATISIASDVEKDLKDIYGDIFEKSMFDSESKTDKGFRSTKYIPFVGRPYHDIYGRGAKTRKSN